MTEYIKREALIEHIRDLPTCWADGGGVYGQAMKYPEGMFDCDDVINSVDNAPAADVVEVRHGKIKWVNRPIAAQYATVTDEYGEKHYGKVCDRIENNPVGYCGECGKRLDDTFMNYCPNCGAKMDSERRKEDG